MNSDLNDLIDKYRSDNESVFNTWFINNDERLKAFRSIRRGVQSVINDIKNKEFGNDYNRLSAPDSGFFSATFATRLTKFARFRDSHRLAPACGRYADDG